MRLKRCWSVGGLIKRTLDSLTLTLTLTSTHLNLSLIFSLIMHKLAHLSHDSMQLVHKHGWT